MSNQNVAITNMDHQATVNSLKAIDWSKVQKIKLNLIGGVHITLRRSKKYAIGFNNNFDTLQLDPIATSSGRYFMRVVSAYDVLSYKVTYAEATSEQSASVAPTP